MTTKLIVLASCLVAVSQARFVDNSYWRIIGGSNAEPGEFPHQISLQGLILIPFSYESFCGGSIIDEKWILTAAHCLRDFRKEFLKWGFFTISAGRHNLNNTEASEQLVMIDSYFVHEKYDPKLVGSPYDIGLIKLRTPLEFNKSVMPISLPKRDTEPTGPVTLCGWGAFLDDLNHTAQVYPNILQKADLEIIDRAACTQTIIEVVNEGGEVVEDEDFIDETNICTGPLTGGLSACVGDSGGALIKKSEDGDSEVVGIVSWTLVPCGRKGAPTVYTKVSSFIDWIENTMSKNYI